MSTYYFICRHLGTSRSHSYFICHRNKIILVVPNCVLLSRVFQHCYVRLSVVVVNIIVFVFVVLILLLFWSYYLIVMFFCVWHSISVTFQMRLLLDRNQHYIKHLFRAS